MTEQVSLSNLSRIGRVGIATFDNPPVNALSQAVRQRLIDEVDAFSNDESMQALVIVCAGRTFFAGADIREFDQPPSLPLLPEVVHALEHSRKPIVAAIHGNALGGGLEIAMACHARVSTANAKLGVPEIKLGLIPGSGGTQRLPRLIGAEKALKMLLEGNPISGNEALQLGLVDALADTELLTAALQLANHLLDGTHPWRRTCDLSVQPLTAAEVQRGVQQYAGKTSHLLATRKLAELMTHSLTLPFDTAVQQEREVFLELRASEQCRALRHVFNAERAAAQVPGIDSSVALLPVNAVGVIGAGTMGSGIALNFLLQGLPVMLVEQQQAALDRGVATVRSLLDRNVATGRSTTAAAEQAFNLLRPSLTMSELANADLIVEAAFETMDVKREIFTELERIARADAILATNTSYLDVNEIAAVTSRPQQVLGMHFFSPAHVMKLVEVVRADHTSLSVLATVLQLAKRLGKLPVVAGVCHGFIGNRMLAVRRRECEQMMLTGASPYHIDEVATRFGFPMGPFRIQDLAGLDLGWVKSASTGTTIRERLCELGRRGQKTQAGYYDYDDKGRPQPSAIVEALIRDFVKEHGLAQRSWSDDEILQRMLQPMIAEGRQILAEGKALRASDIDVVWIHGYGWPRWTGGPMYYGAQTRRGRQEEMVPTEGFEPPTP